MYCVTAGVAVRIASLSRAVFSTRSGVACDCLSDFKPLELVVEQALVAARLVELGEQAP